MLNPWESLPTDDGLLSDIFYSDEVLWGQNAWHSTHYKIFPLQTGEVVEHLFVQYPAMGKTLQNVVAMEFFRVSFRTKHGDVTRMLFAISPNPSRDIISLNDLIVARIDVPANETPEEKSPIIYTHQSLGLINDLGLKISKLLPFQNQDVVSHIVKDYLLLCVFKDSKLTKVIINWIGKTYDTNVNNYLCLRYLPNGSISYTYMDGETYIDIEQLIKLLSIEQ